MALASAWPSMPGTPDPVLGSDVLTFAIALLGAVPLTFLPVAVHRYTDLDVRLALLVGGAGYGVVCSTVWATSLAVAGPWLLPDGVAATVGAGALAAAAVGLPASVAWYADERWRLDVPPVTLFGLTVLILFTCLRIGGESDGYLLYANVVAPLSLVWLAVASGVELGARKLWSRIGDDADDAQPR